MGKISKYTISTAAAATAVGVTATVAAPFVLSAVGFGVAGVTAGSIAAWLQTPVTVTGGWFALCQSAGVLGMAATTKATIGVGTASVTAITRKVVNYIKER